jgi:nucleoside 2-deoxyribosyltransferase
MQIYFAAPLFSAAERAYNERLTAALEALGYQVFLPQRDGVEREREPYATMAPDDWRVAMFTLDRDKILESGIFLFVLDGRVPDEGACVELGIAYAHKLFIQHDKRLLGLQTDSRAAFLGSKLNPMLRVALDDIVQSEEQLLHALGGSSTASGYMSP